MVFGTDTPQQRIDAPFLPFPSEDEQNLYENYFHKIFQLQSLITIKAATDACNTALKGSTTKISYIFASKALSNMCITFGEPLPQFLHTLHERLLKNNESEAVQFATKFVRSENDIKKTISHLMPSSPLAQVRDLLLLNQPRSARIKLINIQNSQERSQFVDSPSITNYLDFLAHFGVQDYSRCFDMIRYKEIVTPRFCNELFFALASEQVENTSCHSTIENVTLQQNSSLRHQAYALIGIAQTYGLFPTKEHFELLEPTSASKNPGQIFFVPASHKEAVNPGEEQYIRIIKGLVHSKALSVAKHFAEKLVAVQQTPNLKFYAKLTSTLFRSGDYSSAELKRFSLLIAHHVVTETSTKIKFSFPNRSFGLIQHLVPAYIEKTFSTHAEDILTAADTISNKTIQLHVSCTKDVKTMTNTCLITTLKILKTFGIPASNIIVKREGC
jgi:hypothetical protein